MNEQSSPPPERTSDDGENEGRPSLVRALRAWLRGLGRGRGGDTSPREAIEELIEERVEEDSGFGPDERKLLLNVLDLRERSIEDAMVPRADIVAIEVGMPLAELFEVFTREGHSRLPVYRGSLDDVLGMVHIKDALAWRGRESEFDLAKVLRRVLFVSPSMRVLELLLEMRVSRVHLALVVDEYGGIDGLVTIEDLVEEIVGEIEDEHDETEAAPFVRRPDGTVDADARLSVEELEQLSGPVLSEDEREEIDTIGGLVVALSGRVPIRGELVRHQSGLEFEVLDADPRRLRRLRIRGLPSQAPPIAAK